MAKCILNLLQVVTCESKMFALRRVTCFRLTDTTTSKLTNRVQQLSSTVSNVSSGSTDAKTEQTKTARCRTNKSDPTNHSPSDEAMFYTLPKEVQNKLFAVYNWHKTTHELFDVMNEAAIMIRRPALQIMQELRSHDWEQPLRRFLLHGRPGTGRSFTLTHLAHFGHKSNYILVHCVSPNAFTRYPQEKATSDYKADRVDTPIDAALLLQHFKAQNAHLLTNLTTSRAYMWTMREKTEQGEPLINVIDHGINRMKHASDAYAVLLKELKLAASANQCRVLMVIDKINLFYWASNIRLIDYRYAEVDNITVARAFKKLFQPDWVSSNFIYAFIFSNLVIFCV